MYISVSVISDQRFSVKSSVVYCLGRALLSHSLMSLQICLKRISATLVEPLLRRFLTCSIMSQKRLSFFSNLTVSWSSVSVGS